MRARRYGINIDIALGVRNSDLRPLARQIGRNHDRALELWTSNIREARLLRRLHRRPEEADARAMLRLGGGFRFLGG